MTTRQFEGPTAVSFSPTTRVALVLRDMGAHTPAELCDLLGLTMQQVHACIHQLEVDEVVGPDGDNPRALVFRGREQVVAAVDIGPHHVRIALCNLAGHVLHRYEAPTDNTPAAHTRIDSFVRLLRQQLRVAGVGAHRLWAVSFAVPATVRRDGRVAESPLLPDWSGIDLAKRLSEVLACPVVLANDGTLSAVAEAALGAGHLASDFVCVCVGRRLCVRPVIDGRPYEGVNHRAGSVSQLYGERIDEHGQITWGLDGNGIHVVEQALAGEPEAVREVEELLDGLAHGLALAIMHHDPELVAVGGSIGSRLVSWRADLTRRVVQQLGGTGHQVNIRFSPLGADSVLVGALVLALEKATTARFGEHAPGPTPDAWKPDLEA